jgi:hypothetical protein
MGRKYHFLGHVFQGVKGILRPLFGNKFRAILNFCWNEREKQLSTEGLTQRLLTSVSLALPSKSQSISRKGK